MSFELLQGKPVTYNGIIALTVDRLGFRKITWAYLTSFPAWQNILIDIFKLLC